jgi:hypothetical protein
MDNLNLMELDILRSTTRDIINPTKSDLYIKTDMGQDVARELLLYGYASVIIDLMEKGASREAINHYVQHAISASREELRQNDLR